MNRILICKERAINTGSIQWTIQRTLTYMVRQPIAPGV